MRIGFFPEPNQRQPTQPELYDPNLHVQNFRKLLFFQTKPTIFDLVREKVDTHLHITSDCSNNFYFF
jgi:hypothetical protein